MRTLLIAVALISCAQTRNIGPDFRNGVQSRLSSRDWFPISPETECTQITSVSGGPITSPNYPYPYPAGVKECWLFTTPNKTHIEFYFPTFKTPVSQAELTIYDGPTAQSNILRQFTGDIYPEIFFSTTNRALMTFTSVTEGGPSSPTGFEGYYASFYMA